MRRHLPNAMCLRGLPLTCLVALWTCLAAAESAPLPLLQVVPVDGPSFTAALQAADARWNLEFVTPSGELRKLPATHLVQWGRLSEPTGGKPVLLADGGVLLAAEVLGIEADHLLVESDLITDGVIQLPLNSIAGVVFRLPLDSRQRDALEDRLMAADGDSDIVLLANGDELTGSVTGWNEKTLQLKTATGSLSIDLSRLKALALNPALRAKASAEGLRAWVGLRDGSRLLVSELQIDGKRAKLVLDAGVVLHVSTEAIVVLTPIGGRVVYLSELSPAGYRHIPFLDLPWPYRANRSVTGAALRADGWRHLFGIGMHSAARLTYELDQPYRLFEAALAIDDETAGRGSVVGRVFTDDGSGQWQLRYESPVIRGGQPPVPVRVELSGAKRISLLIDFADRAEEGDHADWLNARLVKP